MATYFRLAVKESIRFIEPLVPGRKGQAHYRDNVLDVTGSDYCEVNSVQSLTEQTGFTNTNNGSIVTAIRLDGSVSTIASALGVEGAANYYMLLVAPAAYTPTEGYHYTTLRRSGSHNTGHVYRIHTNMRSDNPIGYAVSMI